MAQNHTARLARLEADEQDAALARYGRELAALTTEELDARLAEALLALGEPMPETVEMRATIKRLRAELTPEERRQLDIVCGRREA